MTAEQPDFNALRAERNAAFNEWLESFCKKEGWDKASVKCTFNPDACYCACGEGGPCEHNWDGESWESADGYASSATCSRCGITAMSHDLRTAP